MQTQSVRRFKVLNAVDEVDDRESTWWRVERGRRGEAGPEECTGEQAGTDVLVGG